MVYITGDTHGDLSFFKNPKLKKLTKNDTLIICGDFGFLWDDSEEEKAALEELKKKKYTICFADGVHENHERLGKYRDYRFKGGNAHKIAKNIYHLTRGEIYTFDKHTFFVMGGGSSEDDRMRTEGKTHFKEELPDGEELLHGAQILKENGDKVDYIITHEPPAKAKEFLQLKRGGVPVINPLNTYLQQLMLEVEYKHWYFGSMHIDLPISRKMTAVFDEIIPIKDENKK